MLSTILFTNKGSRTYITYADCCIFQEHVPFLHCYTESTADAWSNLTVCVCNLTTDLTTDQHSNRCELRKKTILSLFFLVFCFVFVFVFKSILFRSLAKINTLDINLPACQLLSIHHVWELRRYLFSWINLIHSNYLLGH